MRLIKRSPLRPLRRAIGWCAAVTVGTLAALVAAVLALLVTAGLLVVGFVGVVSVGLAAMALKARPRQPEGQLLEARRVGGHSWVAYGWDGPR